jgi:hypothetical protein
LKITLPVLLLLLLIIGCQEEKPTLNLVEKSYTSATLPACEGDICPKIDIQLLKAEGKSPLATTINTAIEQYIAANLSISPDDEDKIKTIDQGISNFIDSFRSANLEFPDSPAIQGYEFTNTSVVGFENKSLLSLKMETYSYWGGAHGYSSTSYLNFDKEIPELLTTEKLLKDEGKFKELAEKMFREQEEIPMNGNINETGFFFENDTFSLPINFGFEDDELLLIYNPYEVASYAEGQIIIKIPKADVAPFLSVRL